MARIHRSALESVEASM